MSRRNPPAKWVLPDVVNPPTSTCFMVRVPDNRFHRAAFFGALLDLASAYKWQDDPAHTAKDVALVWRDIVDELEPQLCDLPIPDDGVEFDGEELMGSLCEALRFHNGKLQAFCCGEWVDIAGQPDQGIGGPSQPGGGSPQPPAGGGQACYQGELDANALWLAPTVVNAGDIVELSLATGAGTGDGLIWRCPDGSTFFAGNCSSGTGATSPGDPLNTVNHMRLIFNIDGTYYDAMAGPVTVPGGVVNAQVVLQVNDSALTDNAGTYQIEVCVTNNLSEFWEHTWDLTTTPGPFHIESGFGVWTPGVGWQGTDAGSGDSLLLLRQNDSATITLFDTIVNVTALGGTSTTNAIKHDDPAITIVTTTLVSGSNFLSTGPISVSDSMFIDVYNNPGDTASFALTQIHAKGPGPFPY